MLTRLLRVRPWSTLLRCCLLALAASGLPAARASSQAADTGAAVGTWRGTSLCLVRSSPCHDEVVVYRITRAARPDSVALNMRKVVGGQEEDMASLTCALGTPPASLTCVMPNGTWRFTVRRDSLTGELRLRDGTRFRDIRTARVGR